MKRNYVDGAKLLRALRGACAIAILTAPLAPVYAEDSTFKEDVKQVGRAVSSMGRQVGQEAKKAGKEIGPATKRTGKAVGHAIGEGVAAMKKGGKDVKRAVTGEG